MSGFHSLFIPGPTNMPFGVRQAMDIPLEDQRAPDFPAFTLPLFVIEKRFDKSFSGEVPLKTLVDAATLLRASKLGF